MSDVKVELYIKLMDILQEFQLPGGKFDGHGLIAALVNAKRYEALQSRCEAAEKANESLRAAIARVLNDEEGDLDFVKFMVKNDLAELDTAIKEAGLQAPTPKDET